MSKIALQPNETCAGKVTVGWEIHQCPHMKADPNDRSFDVERYLCAVCGKRDFLDYEEMR